MSRKHFSRKLQRASERYLRSEGSKAFKRAADDQLKTKATELAGGLSDSVIKKGCAAAAGLLVELAEAVEYKENPAAFDKAFSLAEKWAAEPPFVPIDIIRPLIADQPQPLQLTEGQKDDSEAVAGSSQEDDTGPPTASASALPATDRCTDQFPHPSAGQPSDQPNGQPADPATIPDPTTPDPAEPAEPGRVEAIYE